MPKDYLKPEEIWKIYQKLPEELKEAIFSKETSERIFNVCTENKIEREKISEIASLVGEVLLGILPPNEFQKTLEKKLELETNIAKEITKGIEKLIFFPLRSELEKLYKIEIFSPAKPSVTLPPETPSVTPPLEKKPKDVYREPIE